MPEPKWCAISLDETRAYNIREEDRALIKGIHQVYILNRGEATNCCEIRPSYFLIPLYAYVVLTEAACCGDDAACNEIRSDMDERYCYDQCEPIYMHCGAIDGLPAERLKEYGPIMDPDVEDNGEEEVREYWQSNCPL